MSQDQATRKKNVSVEKIQEVLFKYKTALSFTQHQRGRTEAQDGQLKELAKIVHDLESLIEEPAVVNGSDKRSL